MLVKNENNEFVELTDYVNQIFMEGLGEIVTEEEAQEALAQMYLESARQPEMFMINKTEAFSRISIESIDKFGLWSVVRKAFCKIARSGLTIDEIINYILNFIGGLIPGGNLIGELIGKIIRYFLQKGIDKVCPL